MTAKPASLEDLMVAMDVVDTLRHRQELVDRELDAENRRERLIEKLRDIYEAQGIEVTEAILNEGVLALEQDRFSYQPPESSFSVTLAKIYASRSRWLKPLLLFIAVVVAFFVLRYFFVSYPQQQRFDELPTQIGQTFSAIQKTAKNPTILTQATTLVDQAASALNERDLLQAEGVYSELQNLKTSLQQAYEIRIVSRQGELSGVWRIPDANENARNYYLIVEAVDRKGNILPVSITNEEDNKKVQVKAWGVRVDYSVFQQVAADKRDDGIIQNNIVGNKKAGFIKPAYLIRTNGATISQW